MSEPFLPIAIHDGDSDHEGHHDALHAWHNTWIYTDGTRMYLPADFLSAATAKVSNFAQVFMLMG